MKRQFAFVEVLLDPLAKCCVCSEPVLGPYWALYVRRKTDVYEHRVCAPCVVAFGTIYTSGMSMRELRLAVIERPSRSSVSHGGGTRRPPTRG